jgi:hypothetical protein
VSLTTEEPIQDLINASDTERSYVLHLENFGRLNDSYTVSVSGTLPTGWTRNLVAVGVPGDPNSIQVSLVSGESTDLTLYLYPNGNKGNFTTTLTAQSNNHTEASCVQTFSLITSPDLLLIDDDGGEVYGNYEDYYISSLTNTQTDKVWGRWDLSVSTITATSMNTVPVIIWYTGSSINTMTAAKIALMESYLDAGGRLCLMGQGLAWDLRTSAFLADYLHTNHQQPNYAAFDFAGVAGDPIGDGLTFSISGGDGANNQSRQSAIRPSSDGFGSVFLDFSGSALHAGVKASTYTNKSVFCGFGFEAITPQASRDSLLARVVRYLMEPVLAADPRGTTVASTFGLEQNYPNPFNPETVIPYSLAARSKVSLKIYDLVGREVVELASGVQDAGLHEARWNAAALPSGVYFYRLDAVSGSVSHQATRKLVLMK